MIEKLRDIAFKIKIDQINSVEHAAKVETVIKVLSDLIKSYNSFLEIEFSRLDVIQANESSKSNTIDIIKSDLNLFLVDLNFNSFDASLAPNLLNESQLFSDEIINFKKSVFDNYKKDVLLPDYDDDKVFKNIMKKYDNNERKSIYGPIFSSAGNGKDYNLILKDDNDKVLKRIISPNKSKLFYYISKEQKSEKETKKFKTAQVFIKVLDEGEGEEIKKLSSRNVKEVLYSENLDYDTYPFKPNIISYDKYVFVLSRKLDTEVTYDDGMYYISNDDLDIVAWGESREEVESAFSFCFYSIYTNYYNENDKKLTRDAIALKQILKVLIKNVIKNEATQN